MTTAPQPATAPQQPTTLNLTQASQGLRKIKVAMGWAFNPYGGKPMDVDLCCFILDRNGMTREDEDFVFYNNMQGAGLAVKLLGDKTSGGDTNPDMTDAEQITIDFENLSFDIWRIVFVASIYDGVENDQSFDVLRQAVFRIENLETGQEIVRGTFSGHKLGEATAIRVAEISRDGVEWHYNLLKEPVVEGLSAIAKQYGLLISSTT